jgi:hypothetical protein
VSITVYLKLQAVSLLNKMQLQAEICSSNGQSRISVSVPPTRSDVLHARDLAEVKSTLSSYSVNLFCSCLLNLHFFLWLCYFGPLKGYCYSLRV